MDMDRDEISAIDQPAFKNLASIQLSNGTVEALKWLALVFMTIDHVNRFFYKSSIHAAYCMGRLAMPLFAFILAYNLARPGTLSRGVYQRTLKRLFLFGLLATPAYHYSNINQLGQAYFIPLNILFTLFLATTILFIYEKEDCKHSPAIIFLFLVGGFFVEYSWPCLMFCISAWFYCKRPSFSALMINLLSLLFIDLLNGNHYAMLALPILVLATKIDIKTPRIPYFFYGYYPLHLTMFFLLQYN